LRRLIPTETDLNVRRAVSPLLATLILIASVVSAGLVVYGIASGWMGIFGANLKVQAASVDLVKAGDKALLSVSIKNVGNKPLAGIVVTGRDDNGKPFKLALSPADPGQASGNTLVIPLGVSNIVLDGSGNNNHGTIYGAAWVDGKYGKALNFNGVDNYAVIPNSDSFNMNSEITMSAWLYPHNPTAGYTMFIKKQTPGFDFWLNLNGYLYAEIYHPNWRTEGYTCVASKTQLQPNNWYHCVAVYKQNEYFRIYVNGVLDASAPAPNKAIGVCSNPLYLAVSGWMASNNVFYDGFMDEVRIYNRAFDGGEVSFSNANPGLPPTRGLVAWYPMDEGTNAPFSFTAGSSYALTITAYSLDGGFFTVTTAAECR
jgi:hypothetical protein